MATCLYTGWGIGPIPVTGKGYAKPFSVIEHLRLPTDPLFYANAVLQNIAVGSRYWIARASDLTNVLATGVAASTEITLENIPAYANPMLLEVRVRKASESTKYQPYVTYAYLVREGVTIYIAQVPDYVA